jgi:hypothetical protein
MIKQEQMTATARQWVSLFDQGARQAIGAWRTGGERLGTLARERWDASFEECKPKLSEETRRNATRARDAFAGYYAKGIDMTASGATVAVDRVVEAAEVVLDRAQLWQASRA